uniref:TPR repeat-containing protein YDR161W n=1 Tax=Lepeophtheirus salmonis TaxID=72036 RepID=C1BUD4_LEPSM|nr:TPR repeat-containing protein YDR161W [Lepeophtheirus salmonis]
MGRLDRTRTRLRNKLEKKVIEREIQGNVDSFVESASESINRYDYFEAQGCLQRALAINNDHPKALELSAFLLLEGGEVEKAGEFLNKAIAIQPEVGYEKYFTLAQLSSGKESLDIYSRGIDVLTRLKPDSENIRALSNAYVSIAELYTTDLCDDPNAEKECVKAIKSSVDADGENPEALQMKARFHLIKQEFDEARTAMSASLALWLPAYENVISNNQEAGSVDPVEVCAVPYESRIAAVKLCLELEDFDSATRICDGMVEEDDTVADTWYLLGWTYQLRSTNDEDYKSNARYYLNKAKVVHSSNPTPDLQMMEHIDELLSELGPEPEEDKEEVNDVESAIDNPENWETSDEEEEDQMDS